MQGWCANPNGCHPGAGRSTQESVETFTQAPVETVTEMPVEPIEQPIEPVVQPEPVVEPGVIPDAVQGVIDNTTENAISFLLGELIKYGIIAAIVIIAFVFLKKAVVAIIKNAKEVQVVEHAKNTVTTYNGQITQFADERRRAEERRLRNLAERAKNLKDESAIALDKFVNDGKNYYETKVSDETAVRDKLEASLQTNTVQNYDIDDFKIKGLALSDLRDYDDTTRQLFTTKNPDEIFADLKGLDSLTEGLETTYKNYRDVTVPAMETKVKGKRKQAGPASDASPIKLPPRPRLP